MTQLFDRSMNLIWPQGVEHNNVLLLFSDAAPYMIKAGSAMHNFKLIGIILNLPYLKRPLLKPFMMYSTYSVLVIQKNV